MAKKNKAVDAVEPIDQLSNDLPPVEGDAVATEKKPRAPRAGKTFELAVGTLPANNEKPLGQHAVTITEAIETLISEGTTTASREVIMEKAVALGLYEKKPSVQPVGAIFSWWRKLLAGHGWIIEAVAPEVAPEATDPAVL
jgi:hypothetical protein